MKKLYSNKEKGESKPVANPYNAFMRTSERHLFLEADTLLQGHRLVNTLWAVLQPLLAFQWPELCILWVNTVIVMIIHIYIYLFIFCPNAREFSERAFPADS